MRGTGATEIDDEGTVHVDPPPVKLRPQGGGQTRAGGTTTGTGVRITGTQRHVDSSGPRSRPVARPDMRAEPSTQKSGRGGGLLFGAAIVVLLIAGGLGYWALKVRQGGSSHRGTVLLTAVPWARVVSIVDQKDRKSFPTNDAVTPARIELPPGSYDIMLRGSTGSGEVETTVTAVVTENEDTPVPTVKLQGFELEAAVKTYVP
jgi:hypothetical protein